MWRQCEDKWIERGGTFVLIGRQREQAALCGAIEERRSLLVCGPPGSGKTALLEEALSSMTENRRRRCIVCAADGTPAMLWRSLAQALAAAGDPEVLTRVERERGSHVQSENWICSQTSLRIRGILRRAARGCDYSIFLDAAGPLADGTYRLLQEWVWSGRTPVVLLGCGASQHEIGKAARLYWHQGLRLHLGPLELDSAQTLLELEIERFGLTRLANGEFRKLVLEQSLRLPGRIVRLCEMASNAAYQYKGRVKLHTLAVDFLMDPQRPVSRAARHA